MFLLKIKIFLELISDFSYCIKNSWCCLLELHPKIVTSFRSGNCFLTCNCFHIIIFWFIIDMLLYIGHWIDTIMIIVIHRFHFVNTRFDWRTE